MADDAGSQRAVMGAAPVVICGACDAGDHRRCRNLTWPVELPVTPCGCPAEHPAPGE